MASPALEAAPPPVKRARGRPRKKPLPTREAAYSLTQLVLEPTCTQSLAMEQQAQPHATSVYDATFCKAFLTFLEHNLGGEAWLKKLIAQEAAREVRGDPRTEEMKLMKVELEKMGAVVARMTSIAKDDKELDKRILEEAQELKRKHKEVTEMVEPLAKRAANMERDTKAVQSRMKAMEDRIEAMEGKIK